MWDSKCRQRSDGNLGNVEPGVKSSQFTSFCYDEDISILQARKTLHTFNETELVCTNSVNVDDNRHK